MIDVTRLPDLASRALGGAVVVANDEFFAAKENLVLPEPAAARTEFGRRGKEYDGWETRRRRAPGHDWAIVRLGAPGIVAGVVVDTAHFTGNYPPQASLEGAAVEGHPSTDELLKADWQPLLPLSDLAGDTANAFRVDSDRRDTHVRLRIHPDGGVARLRVHGTVVPDPRLVDAGPFDLAALENGGQVTAVSDEFYGRPSQLIGRGPARSMGEGWETARRRDSGNDWVEVALACEGVVNLAELDTSYFLGNAPGSAAITGVGPDGEVPLLPRTRLQPDTRHRFVLDSTPGVARVRLDVFPDGGMARLRLWGRPTPAGRAALGRRWFGALPDVQALEVLGSVGVPPQVAGRLVGARPLAGGLPPAVARLLDGQSTSRRA
jgi:allantoicase